MVANNDKKWYLNICIVIKVLLTTGIAIDFLILSFVNWETEKLLQKKKTYTVSISNTVDRILYCLQKDVDD